MSLPSLSLLGVSDIGRLSGSNDVRKFFLKNLAVRFSNETYELMNLGFFHSGSSYAIKSFADGAIFEELYFTQYFEKRVYDEKANRKAMMSYANIVRILKKHGVKTLFILAPDKLEMYPSRLPWYVEKLWGKTAITPPQPECKAVVEKYGVKCLDAYSYLNSQKDKYQQPMFCYAGIHWNALASTLCAEKILSDMGFKTKHLIGVTETEDVRYDDNDIGKLMNIIVNPILIKNINYLPVFQENSIKPNKGSAMVVGDSFTWQIGKSIIDAGAFPQGKVLICDKKVCTEEEFENIAKDLKLFIIVHQPPFFSSLENQLGKIIRGTEQNIIKYYSHVQKDTILDKELCASR